MEFINSLNENKNIFASLAGTQYTEMNSPPLWPSTPPELYDRGVPNTITSLSDSVQSLVTDNWETDSENISPTRLKKTAVFVGYGLIEYTDINTNNTVSIDTVLAIDTDNNQYPDYIFHDITYPDQSLSNPITTDSSTVHDLGIHDIAIAIYAYHINKETPLDSTNYRPVITRLKKSFSDSDTDSDNPIDSSITNSIVLFTHWIEFLASIGNYHSPWEIDRTGESRIDADGTKWVAQKTVNGTVYIKAINGSLEGQHEQIPVEKFDSIPEFSFTTNTN